MLSACNTALGKEVRGEGLVGIVRGFMYAGASRVVASLWRVDDRATLELMRRFYDQMLRQGRPPAAALRQAQIELWQQKQWRPPFFWAAFVLQGEWRQSSSPLVHRATPLELPLARPIHPERGPAEIRGAS